MVSRAPRKTPPASTPRALLTPATRSFSESRGRRGCRRSAPADNPGGCRAANPAPTARVALRPHGRDASREFTDSRPPRSSGAKGTERGDRPRLARAFGRGRDPFPCLTGCRPGRDGRMMAPRSAALNRQIRRAEPASMDWPKPATRTRDRREARWTRRSRHIRSLEPRAHPLRPERVRLGVDRLARGEGARVDEASRVDRETGFDGHLRARDVEDHPGRCGRPDLRDRGASERRPAVPIRLCHSFPSLLVRFFRRS